MLHTLHGFLGQSSDWDFLRSGVTKFKAYNLYQVGKPSAECGYHQWAAEFTKTVKAQNNTKNILLGYSLGGRLALHSLLKDPQLWNAAVIVSTHPGLATEHEKVQRLEEDHAWGERFLRDPWDQLMNDWNKRPVFKANDQSIKRHEKDISRKLSRDFFQYWSLGKQDYLVPAIQNLNIPILWITGEQDHKYTKLAESIHLKHTKSKKVIIPDCGHRVPWEDSETFKKHVNQFVIDIN